MGGLHRARATSPRQRQPAPRGRRGRDPVSGGRPGWAPRSRDPGHAARLHDAASARGIAVDLPALLPHDRVPDPARRILPARGILRGGRAHARPPGELRARVRPELRAVRGRGARPSPEARERGRDQRPRTVHGVPRSVVAAMTSARPARPPGEDPAWRALMLVSTAGFVDSIGVLALAGTFVAFMSGNTSAGGAIAGTLDLARAARQLFPIPLFVAGIYVGALAVQAVPPETRHRRYALVLAVEC